MTLYLCARMCNKSSANMRRRSVGKKKNRSYEFPVPDENQYPWLVYRHGDDEKYQTFCTINSSSGDSVVVKKMSNLRRQGIVYCSPDGNRILLRKFTPESQEFFAWSIKEDEVIHLPSLGGFEPNIIRHGFLVCTDSDSSSSSLLVLLFVEEIPLILYFRIGDREQRWREFYYAESIQAQTGYPLKPRYFLCSPVIFNGTIYATASGATDLVQITVDYDNDHCETRLLMPEEDSVREGFLAERHCQGFVSCDFVRIFLVYLAEDLYRISMYPRSMNRYGEALSISILRFDFCSNTWQQRTSLNGGAVFLCPDYALSLPGGTNSEWSYIYFAFDENDQTLFSYRVEDEKVTSHLLCPPNREIWLPYWIMPALPIDDDHDDHEFVKELEKCLTSNARQDAYDFWKKCSRRKRRRLMKQKNKASKRRRLMKLGSEYGNNILSLCDLPQDVLGLIAGNLCFVDHIHLLRCVSRVCSCSSSIRPRWNSFPPTLIYKDRGKGVYSMVADSNLNIKLPIEIPDVLRDYEIRCSRDGWLLLENNFTDELKFLNPLTVQVLRAGTAARLRAQHHGGSLNFTVLDDCSILAMSNSRPVIMGDIVYHLGDNRWLGRGQLIKDQDGECSIHWEVFTYLILPSLKFSRQNYLTECGGELVAILVGDDDVQGKVGPGVRVFKLRRDHKEWEEMETLGEYCLYVSSLSSTSCLAQTPDVANRIYFPKFYKNELVYYSLSTKRYQTVGSQHQVQSFNQISWFPDCAWIKPGWSSTLQPESTT